MGSPIGGDTTEESISELKDKTTEAFQTEMQREKK